MLGHLPLDILTDIGRAGIQYAATAKNVLEFVDPRTGNAYLDGTHPFDRDAGQDWATVSGVYVPGEINTVVISTEFQLKAATIDKVLHETGHALDFAWGRTMGLEGASESAAFLAAYEKAHMQPQIDAAGNKVLNSDGSEIIIDTFRKRSNGYYDVDTPTPNPHPDSDSKMRIGEAFAESFAAYYHQIMTDVIGTGDGNGDWNSHPDLGLGPKSGIVGFSGSILTGRPSLTDYWTSWTPHRHRLTPST